METLTGETIEIFVNNNESPREEMEEMTVVETDDIPRTYRWSSLLSGGTRCRQDNEK